MEESSSMKDQNKDKKNFRRWELIKLKNFLHNKGNHQYNEKTYRKRENISKQCDQKEVNIQNIEIAHITQYQKKKKTIKK